MHSLPYLYKEASPSRKRPPWISTAHQSITWGKKPQFLFEALKVKGGACSKIIKAKMEMIAFVFKQL